MPSTSDKLRQTNENIIISEIRSLNTRVAELLEQFGLLTLEIGNVADELERQQVGVDSCRTEMKDLQAQFKQLEQQFTFTKSYIRQAEKRIADLDQRCLDLDKRLARQSKENE